jgi:monofunctional biosynthetic peptidoglycan transglycosylase
MTTEMFKVKLCPTSDSYTPLRQISPFMISSVLLSEDASFYQHNGFDFAEIKNSFQRNLSEGEFARGGSTITQQLVKNVFLSPDKTLTRKLKEAILTYDVERHFKKNEILERYLNVVEFGPNLYGIRAAARYYFGKTPSELNVLESAFLTSLLPNPKKYSVSHRKNKLTPYMRNRVLVISGKLRATGRISDSEYQSARASVDLFPWKGLGGGMESTDSVLDSIEKTDFMKEAITPEPERSYEQEEQADPEAPTAAPEDAASAKVEP